MILKYMLLACCCMFGVQACTAQQKEKPANGNGFAVVELFTSEGCSSCPPADALLAELKEQYGDKLYVLSFHVDYWNRLGWKDAFSSSVYTQRQQQYAAAFSEGSVYTPQAIVNGREQRVGSSRNDLQVLINNAIASGKNRSPEVTATEKNGSVHIRYYAAAGSGFTNIALVQLHADTHVQRGENQGRHLQHVYVVRAFTTSDRQEGSVSLQLPAGLSTADCRVMVYTQQRNDLRISGATEVEIH